MRCFSLILLFLFLVAVSMVATAQCGTGDFTLESEACRDQKIRVTPDDAHASVEWDFCSGDFNSLPTAESVFQITAAVGRPSLELVEDDGTWFGFITGTWTNSLQVLEFGNGLEHAPTKIYPAGNLNSYLNGPASIRMVRDDDIWYGIIHNTGSAEILRVTFGNQFSEVNDVTTLTSSVGYINSGLAMGKDPIHGWVGLISESNNSFTIIRYGHDLHPSSPEDIITTAAVPNPNSLGDIDLINVCGQWFAAAVNLAGGNTYLLTFGEDLFSLPEISQIATLSLNNSARLRFAQEGTEYFLFVASLDGIWHTLKFGETVNDTPIVENQNDLNGTLTPETYALALVKENSVWTIFNVTQDNGQVYRIKYTEACSALPASSQESVPIVQFAAAGTYSISMQMFSGGQVSTKSKSITVSSESAPDINFLAENVCAGHDVFFTAINISANIEAYEWSFGDLATSDDANTAHQYAADGKYDVTLKVMGSNECFNNAFKSITIFPEPLANFSAEPAPVLCTNNALIFTNNTVDVYNGQLSYQWFVDEAPVSSERDLVHTFSTTGIKTIKLVTSLPGCANVVTKTTSSVEAGPVVDFTYSGTCENEMFSFQHQISDPVQSYLWDFGDTNNSTDPHPSHTFQDHGNFQVSLTATNAAGCNNVKSKTVEVQSRPIPEFSADPPPNTCTGVNTIFENETVNPDGRAIAEWLWDFGDAIESQFAGEYVFSNAGTYTVTLTATTGGGCTGVLEKQITVLQSPSTDIAFTPPCVEIPVVFTGAQNDVTYWYWEIGTSYYNTASATHTFRSPGDYPLYIELTGSNNCVSTATRTIHVPAPLRPDFTLIRNCVGHEAVLMDITSGEDAVVSREWHLNGADVFTGPSVTHAFLQEGNENISLKVTTLAGCTYSATRVVDIVPSPVASFSSAPSEGAYPLEVSFENTSTFATDYLWEFWPGATSTDVSPNITFVNPGAHEVKLTAFNSQQCEDSFTAVITTVDPRPDADIEMVNLITNDDGSMKLIVTIHNKGNTVLKELSINVDFSGSVTLRKIADDPIPPDSKFNYVFSTDILNPETLRYLCVSIDVPNDLSPSGNRRCNEFENKLFVFPVYPNPAMASMNVEWISNGGTVRLTLVDPSGKNLLSSALPAAPGLNHQAINLGGLETGLYVLSLDDGTTRITQRVLVLNRP